VNKKQRDKEIAEFADFMEPHIEQAMEMVNYDQEEFGQWLLLAMMIKQLKPDSTIEELLPEKLFSMLNELGSEEMAKLESFSNI